MIVSFVKSTYFCRQISTQASTRYRGISSIIESSSVNRYHSLIEENPYENVTMESQTIEASDYANEGACATTTDDLIDKHVVTEKPFKKYGRFVSFDDEAPRRQESRDSASSTPYESIVIKDDSMSVSFTKYWLQISLICLRCQNSKKLRYLLYMIFYFIR